MTNPVEEEEEDLDTKLWTAMRMAAETRTGGVGQTSMRLLASRGFGAAMSALAHFVAWGVGTFECDRQLAIRLYESAISARSSPADRVGLALLLLEDARETGRALALCETAAESGDAIAVALRAYVLLTRDDHVDRDPAAALAALREATHRGEEEGEGEGEGEGVGNEDVKKDALFFHALLLEVGAQGVDPDVARAATLYARAGGHADATCRLGLLVERGFGHVPGDAARARDLYLEAIRLSQGDGTADEARNGEAERFLRGAQRALVAKRLFAGIATSAGEAAQFADAGSSDPFYALGLLLAHGAPGVPPNHAQATHALKSCKSPRRAALCLAYLALEQPQESDVDIDYDHDHDDETNNNNHINNKNNDNNGDETVESTPLTSGTSRSVAYAREQIEKGTQGLTGYAPLLTVARQLAVTAAAERVANPRTSPSSDIRLAALLGVATLHARWEIPAVHALLTAGVHDARINAFKRDCLLSLSLSAIDHGDGSCVQVLRRLIELRGLGDVYAGFSALLALLEKVTMSTTTTTTTTTTTGRGGNEREDGGDMGGREWDADAALLAGSMLAGGALAAVAAATATAAAGESGERLPVLMPAAALLYARAARAGIDEARFRLACALHDLHRTRADFGLAYSLYASVEAARWRGRALSNASLLSLSGGRGLSRNVVRAGRLLVIAGSDAELFGSVVEHRYALFNYAVFMEVANVEIGPHLVDAVQQYEYILQRAGTYVGAGAGAADDDDVNGNVDGTYADDQYGEGGVGDRFLPAEINLARLLARHHLSTPPRHRAFRRRRKLSLAICEPVPLFRALFRIFPGLAEVARVGPYFFEADGPPRASCTSAAATKALERTWRLFNEAPLRLALLALCWLGLTLCVVLAQRVWPAAFAARENPWASLSVLIASASIAFSLRFS